MTTRAPLIGSPPSETTGSSMSNVASVVGTTPVSVCSRSRYWSNRAGLSTACTTGRSRPGAIARSPNSQPASRETTSAAATARREHVPPVVDVDHLEVRPHLRAAPVVAPLGGDVEPMEGRVARRVPLAAHRLQLAPPGVGVPPVAARVVEVADALADDVRVRE